MKRIFSLITLTAMLFTIGLFTAVAEELIIVDYDFENQADDAAFLASWGGHYLIDDTSARGLVSFIDEPGNSANRVMQMSLNTENMFYTKLGFAAQPNEGKIEISYRVKYADASRVYGINVVPFAINTYQGDIGIQYDEYGNWDYKFFPCQQDMLADWCEIKAIVDFDTLKVNVAYNDIPYPAQLSLDPTKVFNELKFIFYNGEDTSVNILFDDFLIKKLEEEADPSEDEEVFIVNDDFEDLNNLTAYKSKWDWGTQSKLSLFSETPENNVLKYESGSDNDNWPEYSFPVQSGKNSLVVSYRIKYADDSISKPYGNVSPLAFGDGMWVVSAQSDKLNFWNHESQELSLSIANSLNDWLDVKAIFDFENGFVKLYYNGRLFNNAPVPLIKNDGVTYMDSLSSIKLHFPANVTVYIDDLKIKSEEKLPYSENIVADDNFSYDDMASTYFSKWTWETNGKLSLASEAGTNNRVLQYDSGNGNNWFEYTFPKVGESGGIASVSYRVKYAPNSANKPYGEAVVYPFALDGGSWSIFADTDKLNSWSNELPIANALDDWLNINAIFNFDSGKITLYYNGQLFSNNLDIPAKSTDGLTAIKFCFPDNITAYFDDILVKELPEFMAYSPIDGRVLKESPYVIKFSDEFFGDPETAVVVKKNGIPVSGAELTATKKQISITIPGGWEREEYAIYIDGLTDAYGREITGYVHNLKGVLSDVDIYGTLVVTEDTDLVVELIASNDTAGFKTSEVFVAVYMGNKLLDVKHEKVMLTAGNELPLLFTFTDLPAGTKTIKSFNWADTGSLKPIYSHEEQ